MRSASLRHPGLILIVTSIFCVHSMIFMLISSARCYTILNRWSSPLAIWLSGICDPVRPALMRSVILASGSIPMPVCVIIRCLLFNKFDPSGTRLIIFYGCFTARILSPRFRGFLIRFITLDLLSARLKKNIVIFCLSLRNFNDSFFINIINNSIIMRTIIMNIIRQRKED